MICVIQDLDCMKQLVEHLLVQCKRHSCSSFEQLSQLLQDTKVSIGLLVNERFLNLPVQLGSLALQSLV